MIRHKFLGRVVWDHEFLDELDTKGLVDFEYDHSITAGPGCVFVAKESKEKENFLAIATQRGTVITSWNGWRRTRKKTRTMFALNKAGAEYIQGLLIEERI
jgi:hypothetical protein